MYAAEVEKVLAEHPALLEAAVLGVPDSMWGEVGAAALVLKPGKHVTEEEMLEHCRKRLAKFKCPRYIKFYTSLPKNALNKVVKREIYPDFAERFQSRF